MFCSKCGTPLPNDARFCPSCGAPVASQPIQENNAVSSPKTESAPPMDVPPPTLEDSGKISAVANFPKRKKAPLIALAAGVALCLILPVVAILNPFAQRKAPWSQYATVGDLSEVSWYLQQVYQIEDLTTCQFYDYFEMMEVNYLLVRLPSETEEVQDGKFLIFGYDMNWCDGGGKCYEASPAVEVSRKQIGTTDSGSAILQVSVVASVDGVPQCTGVIIAQNDNGQVESLLTGYIMNEYYYNDAGQVEQIVISEANTASWNVIDNFADCYETGNVTFSYNIGFAYNADGSLRETTQILNEESISWQIFTYENEERVRVEDTGCMPSAPGVVSFVRDNAGRVCAYSVESKNGKPVNKYVQFSYQPDGIVNEGLSVYEANPFGEEIRVDNFSTYYSDAPVDKWQIICNQLYNAAVKNGVDENSVPNDGAVVRAETVVAEYDSGTDVHYGSFIVDIPEIEHSYRVQFEWSNNPTNPNLSGYAVLVTCPENEYVIYSSFDCTDMLIEQEQLAADINNAYPIMKDLPIHIDYFVDGYGKHIWYDIEGDLSTYPDGSSEFKIIITNYYGYSYDDAIQRIINLGYDPDDYEIEYVTPNMIDGYAG